MLKKILSSSGIYLLSNMASAAMPFLFLPMFTRVMTVENFGRSGVFLAVGNVLLPLIGLGLVSYYQVEFFRRGEQPGQVAPVLGAGAVCSAVMLLICWFVMTVLNIGGGAIWGGAAALWAASMLVVQVFLGVLQVTKKAAIYGLLQFLLALSQVAVSFALVYFWSPLWQARAAGVLIAAAIMATILFAVMLSRGWLSLQQIRMEIRPLLIYCLPLLPHTIGAIFIAQSDRFVIDYYFDDKKLGIYLAALQLGLGVQLCAEAFNKAFSPYLLGRLANADILVKKALVGFLYKAGGGFMVFSLMAAIALYLLAPVILSIKTDELGAIVFFICLAGGGQGLYLLITNFVFFSGKTGALSISTATVGVINLLLMVLSISLVGIVGPAIAYMLSRFILFGMTLRLQQKCYPLPWR